MTAETHIYTHTISDISYFSRSIIRGNLYVTLGESRFIFMICFPIAHRITVSVSKHTDAVMLLLISIVLLGWITEPTNGIFQLHLIIFIISQKSIVRNCSKCLITESVRYKYITPLLWNYLPCNEPNYFTSLHVMPVCLCSFVRFHFYLKTQVTRTVRFTRGKVTCVHRFRTRRQRYEYLCTQTQALQKTEI